MKPRKRTITFTKVIYDCGNSSHHHMTEDVARKCIESSENAKKIKESFWSKDELLTMLCEYHNGKTATALSLVNGISKSRQAELIRKAAMMLQKMKSEITDPIGFLSVRAKNCLMNAGAYSFSDIEDLLSSGEMGGIPNLGRKTAYEIEEWVKMVKINQ
jgi:hypothetical protein